MQFFESLDFFEAIPVVRVKRFLSPDFLSLLGDIRFGLVYQFQGSSDDFIFVFLDKILHNNDYEILEIFNYLSLSDREIFSLKSSNLNCDYWSDLDFFSQGKLSYFGFFGDYHRAESEIFFSWLKIHLFLFDFVPVFSPDFDPALNY